MTPPTLPPPTLTTARLTLRPPHLADFERRAATAATNRALWDEGDIDSAAAWRLFASGVGQWPLLGYGPFTVTMGRDYVGEVGLYHPITHPEPELVWSVVPEAEGLGVAVEAAVAVMAWARGTLGLHRLVTYVDPEHFRTLATAMRLGGVVDERLTAPNPGDLVVVYDLTVPA